MRIAANSKLLFIGDSITDASRSPSGEETPWAPSSGLGQGYVNLVNARLYALRPDLNIRVINRGISGNTILDLKARWDEDVVAHQPDWLSVMIGINDVWRQFDVPRQAERHVLPDVYEQTLDTLLDRVRGSLKGLILMTPYVIEHNRDDPMRIRMTEYGNMVKETAKRFDAVFVDTQAAFDKILEHAHPMAIAWDRIHPGTTGHMVIARAFLDAIGFE